ncbi:hypothetical protein PPTG_07161 [Phytophthora nicotianae INRA-310]|uniref:Uncharacterized protein n=3 Tax=Phytophthora nicotianae TaxID=4792 RepID=W2QP76_PHYN3|nr:hypothetical protein PPTG_07161 [Phytophthora nicotianae INRA-310]ETN14913.1 hypothetical protein PPTG_07161 [Phytophthora nicotianae INRA-310]
MMPLTTPLASPGPARTRYDDHETLEDPSEVYGTFHGREVPDIGERPHVSSKLWRSVGIATLLLVVASYMLLQSHYDSVRGREESKTSSISSLVAPEVHQKAQNEVHETTTFSHKHKDQNESDGLSKLESKFLDSVDTTEIRKFHGAYASVPHPAGSHQDYKTALFTAEQFESFGLKAEIVEYYPLLSLPIH